MTDFLEHLNEFISDISKGFTELEQGVKELDENIEVYDKCKAQGLDLSLFQNCLDNTIGGLYSCGMGIIMDYLNHDRVMWEAFCWRSETDEEKDVFEKRLAENYKLRNGIHEICYVNAPNYIFTREDLNSLTKVLDKFKQINFNEKGNYIDFSKREQVFKALSDYITDF